MADNDPKKDPNNTDPNEPDPNEPDPGSNIDGNDPEPDKTYSEADYKKLQSESINRKSKIDKIEAELKKFKDDKLSESEKKDAKIVELEKEKQDAVKSKEDADVNAMITSQASTKGFGDIDVAKLIIKEELKLEEDVSEATIKKAVDKVAKEKAYLISGDDTEINKGNFKKGDKPIGEKTADELFDDLMKEKIQG